MSYCKQIGKDRIIFATPEELSQESKIKLPEPKEEDREPGLVLPNGDINWNCPCIGGMASGPCGYQFREAFSCFHNSQSESRGAECIEKFAVLQECMASYPNLYPKRSSDDDDDDDLNFGENDDESHESHGRSSLTDKVKNVALTNDDGKSSS